MGYTDYLRLKDAGDAAERSFIDFLHRNGLLISNILIMFGNKKDYHYPTGTLEQLIH